MERQESRPKSEVPCGHNVGPGARGLRLGLCQVCSVVFHPNSAETKGSEFRGNSEAKITDYIAD